MITMVLLYHCILPPRATSVVNQWWGEEHVMVGWQEEARLEDRGGGQECGVRLEVWWLVFVPPPGLPSPSIEAAWKTMADGRLLLLPYCLRAMH